MNPELLGRDRTSHAKAHSNASEPEPLQRLREALREIREEEPPSQISSLHGRCRQIAAEIVGRDIEALEELRCQMIQGLDAQEANRFIPLHEIVSVDLMILSAEGEMMASLSDPDGKRLRWIRCCLNDLEAAREALPRGRGDGYARMGEVIALTQSYLHLEFLCPEYPRELALQGLEVRRGLEKLAYETIAEVSAMGLRDNRMDLSQALEVAKDLKVIYHHAVDAGRLATLTLLGRREGVWQALEMSCAAAALAGKAASCHASEGVFRSLEAAEIYARMGLEARVAACLDRAGKLAPALPPRERSAAFLRIEQIQRQPARQFLGPNE